MTAWKGKPSPLRQPGDPTSHGWSAQYLKDTDQVRRAVAHRNKPKQSLDSAIRQSIADRKKNGWSAPEMPT